jgi:integrase
MIADDHSYTTIGIYMRNLKHIINRAIGDKLIHEYPFGDPKKGKYQIPEGRNTKKTLTISDIEKLFNYTPSGRNEYLALNYWLFSYLCNGMNMVDVANLKFKNIKDNNIEFIRQKTRDTTKEVPIIKVLFLPEVQQIIDRLGNEDKIQESYIFPIFKAEYSEIEKHKRLKQHIKNTNKYIRRVAKSVGINENITTYWARHSYSTILKRSGAPIEFISEQLGHQSTKVTKHYLDSFEDEQREKYSSVLIPTKQVLVNDPKLNDDLISRDDQSL